MCVCVYCLKVVCVVQLAKATDTRAVRRGLEPHPDY